MAQMNHVEYVSHVKIGGLWMVDEKRLARKLKLKLNGVEVGETPMLVPSFSSRTNINVGGTIDMMRDVINGPILISAYDVCYSKNFPDIEFPELIFLDSGGYECAIDSNISEIGYYNPESLSWTSEKYLEIIKCWKRTAPTVLISYDHPSKKETIENQLDAAKELFNGVNDVLKEFLIKPEKSDKKQINLKNLRRNIDSLTQFDIIGVTEKEVGRSIFERMVNIARIRMELDRNDITVPLHVFGSLDTITTPLYYFAGADIFDGLSWLRFTFHEGNTFYTSSLGPKLQGIEKNISRIQARNIEDNITYLLKLKLQLEEFQADGKFDQFGETNSKFFSDAYKSLQLKMR